MKLSKEGRLRLTASATPPCATLKANPDNKPSPPTKALNVN
jgi:hypothetical protein